MGKKHKSIQVSEVVKQSSQTGKVGPVILNFRHAPFSPFQLANNQVEADMSVVWKSKKPNLSLNITTPNMSYHNSQDQVPKYHNTFIAIRNKKTGKTRLIEANGAVMVPTVSAPATLNPLLLEPDTKKDQTWQEKRESGKHLIKAFGQAKGQRFYEQQDRMKVEADQVEDKVARAAGGVTEDKLAAAAPVVEIVIVPPTNREAKRKEDVFNLNDLLTVSEQDSLADAAETVLSEYNSATELDRGVKERIFSPLGVKLLSDCLASSGDIRGKSAIILYLEAIIKFTKLRPGEFKKGYRSLQSFIPLGVKKKVWDLFTTGPNNNRCLSPEVQDRAVCYIITLALLATNYKLDLSLLTESIRTRLDKLKKLITMLGASMHADSFTQQNSVVLRLPLATFNVAYSWKKKKN